MKREIGTAIFMGALVLALGACGGDSQAASAAAPAAQAVTDSQPAPTQPVADTSAATSGNPEDAPPGAGGPRIMGQVVAVDGATVTVQDPRQQTTTSILLTSATEFFKQAAVDLAGISVGETVSAMGTQDGDLFTAMQIRVGAAGGPGTGPGTGPGAGPGQGAPGNGAPPEGQQPPSGADQSSGPRPGGGPGAMLTGTVTSATDTALTVQTADGTTVQITLADGGQAMQQVAGTAADLTTGVQIMATGTTDGTTFTAGRVEIMPAMQPQP